MAPVDGLVIGLVSLLVGALAIHIAASILLSADQSYLNAVFAAAVGSLVYSVLGFLGNIPLLGPLLLLLLWIGVINWRYPGGWLEALIIGVGAWGSAIVILWILSFFRVVNISAIGVPV